MLDFFSLFISSFFSMLTVAFFSLLERKILGIGQERYGPNKVLFWGLFQPFSDVFKLIMKKFLFPTNALFSFFFFPLFGVVVMLLFWGASSFFLFSSFGLFYFCFIVCIGSVSGIVVLFSGWMGSSAYSVLGGIRALVQFVSYEVSMSFLWFFLFFYMGGFSIFSESQTDFSMSFFFFIVAFFFFLQITAETQRAPFDFAEGESELVSGFNIEFSSVLFAIIFLTEYGMLLFFGWCFSYFFLSFLSFFLLGFWAGLVGVFVVILRGSFPRLRFDLLQSFSWKFVLPFSMLFFGFMFLLWI